MAGLTKDYVHTAMEEVRAISGGYQLEKEMAMEIDGRRALCLVGYGVVDSSCCGVGGCRFVFVPGYLVRERYRRTEAGLAVSEVEPITDPAVRSRIADRLKITEMAQQVNFDD